MKTIKFRKRYRRSDQRTLIEDLRKMKSTFEIIPHIGIVIIESNLCAN